MSLGEIERLLHELTEQRVVVAGLLETVLTDARAGRTLDPRALDGARTFSQGLERALRLLEAHDATPSERTVAAATAALRELLLRDQARTFLARQREALVRLQRLAAPVRFELDRARLQALVEDLTSAAEWTADQESLARALSGFVRVSDLHAAGDPDDQIPDVDLEMRPLVPPELQRLFSATIAGSVTVAPEAASGDEPPVHIETGPERADRMGPAAPPLPPEPEPQPPAPEAVAEPTPDARGMPAVEAASGPDAELPLVRLLERRRYGLAAHLLRAMGEPETDVRLLQAAALGEVTRSPAGIVTPAFRDIVADIGERARDASEPVRLAAFAAATRAALVSPASGAADLVLALRYAVRGSGATEAVASAIYEASSRGVTYTNAAMATVRDLVELQAEVESLARHAADVLDQARSRTVKYQAATDVWKTWVSGSGMLARLMRPAADNQMEKAGEVLQQVVALRSKGVLDKRLDEDHARARPGRREKLIAGARQTLLGWADDLLEDAVRWANAVSALDAARAVQGHDQWRLSAEEALRAQVSRHADDLFSALRTLAADPSAARLRAAAIAAGDSLHETFGLLRGEALAGDEVPPPEVLNGELLKVASLDLGRDLEPERSPAIPELVAAAACDDWEAVFHRRVDEMDHDGTRAVIDIVRRVDPSLAGRLDSRREEERRRADRRLRADLATASTEIERARRLGHVDDGTGLNLAAQVEELGRRLERDEFAPVKRALAGLQLQFEAAQEAARHAAEERLAAAIENSGGAVARHEARIRQRIDQGDVVTADEFIAQAEATGELTEPEPDPDGLAPWYPGFAERLARTPLTRQMAEAVAAGTRWEGFDFSRIPANRRALARRALEGWLQQRKGAGGPAASWSPLQDVLALMGVRAERENRLGQRAKDHLWREIVGVARTGRALVPQFGSASAGVDGGRLRLLFCWSAPRPETIVEWCHSEGQEAHTLVLCPDLFTIVARRELATMLRRQARRQAIGVVDDAVMLWLCLAPEPPFESLMRAVLPFTAINPYSPWSTGNVPSEVFYGRKHELEEVKAPNGTSFIFGGRQFGKSALLRKAEREFGSGPDRQALYVDLTRTEVGTRRPPEAIWEVLWRELGQRDLWPERVTGRIQAERFADAVRDWLRRHPKGRLLLLLDECDRFLEADAQQAQPFATVAQLKTLREETGGRFKPVFAGLHLVQRYQDVPNQPLAHLGRPISIGPLHPRDAFDLISTPVNALGYRFTSDDLVYRITAFCGNHPNLLQFFGEALLKRMLVQPVPAGGPPYEIVEREVEAVIADRELLGQFRDRFRLTIELDPRYKVVADVIAYEAVERGGTVTMRVDEIRRLATDWWPAGFQAMQSEDAFRSVLDEMVGLGVLVSTASGYRMRTPNVLRLLGNVDEIIGRLDAASEYELPKPFEADSHRRELSGGVLSPLTEKQLGDLLKPRSRCVVVVGSEATAVGRVAEAVKDGAAETGLDVHVERLRPGRAVREPAPRGVHTIWVIDATEAGWQDAAHAAERAAAVAGRRAVTAIVLANAAHAQWLTSLIGSGQTGLELMELRRLDSAGLRWMEQMPAYGSPATRETVLAKTGGWPVLVDRFRGLAQGSEQSFDAIVGAIEADMEDGARLIDAVGLRRSPLLERVWAALAELDEPGTAQELAAFLELEPDEAPALELLRMLGALAPRSDGRMVCEDTLRTAWLRLAPA